MNTSRFSWIALGLGALVALILVRFGALGEPEGQGLPLLTTLFLAEFGFVLSAAGAFFGFRHRPAQGYALPTLLPPIACVLLAAGFAWIGLAVWDARVAL